MRKINLVASIRNDVDQAHIRPKRILDEDNNQIIIEELCYNHI